jgi:hypothetical protein
MTTLHFDPELLRMDFIGAAGLRRAYAEKYRDRRKSDCIAAAELLEKLGSTVDAVDTSTLDAYGHLFEEDCAISEEIQEGLREIGFSWWPENATEFVRAFIPHIRPQNINLAYVQPMGNA